MKYSCSCFLFFCLLIFSTDKHFQSYRKVHFVSVKLTVYTYSSNLATEKQIEECIYLNIPVLGQASSWMTFLRTFWWMNNVKVNYSPLYTKNDCSYFIYTSVSSKYKYIFVKSSSSHECAYLTIRSHWVGQRVAKKFSGILL